MRYFHSFESYEHKVSVSTYPARRLSNLYLPCLFWHCAECLLFSRHFLQWRKHYRSEMLAAKRKQEGSHWSKITRAFLQREYCLSSLTCQGGAKKQRPRNYLSFNLLSLISTLARAYLNLAISSVGFVMAICVRFLLRVNICSSLAKT